MERLGLTLMLALTLALWGCSSGSGAGGAGGEGGMGGAGGEGGEGGIGGVGGFVIEACIGDDQQIQCDNDMSALLWQCADCRLIGSRCPDGAIPRKTGLAECMNIALGLSFECGTCYANLWVCLEEECTVQCDPNVTGRPDSCRCVDCGLQKCDDEFEACAKFRMSDGVPACPGPPACT